MAAWKGGSTEMLVLDFPGVKGPGEGPVTSKATVPQRAQALLTTGPGATPQARESMCFSSAPRLVSL